MIAVPLSHHRMGLHGVMELGRGFDLSLHNRLRCGEPGVEVAIGGSWGCADTNTGRGVMNAVAKAGPGFVDLMSLEALSVGGNGPARRPTRSLP